MFPKILLISHFYNEERLLPYWIRHHKAFVDHAILINHGSTDRSVSIINKLAPTWEIIDSSLKEFDAILTDFEVQNIEAKHSQNWKICLNTTEFLCGPVLEVLAELEKQEVTRITCDAFIMVDKEPNNVLDKHKSLMMQKPWGVRDNKIYDFLFRGASIKKLVKYLLRPHRHIGRQRLLHKTTIGGYHPGRHDWFIPAQKNESLFICWYGFSPWDEVAISRKIGIGKKVPKVNHGMGEPHKRKLEAFAAEYKRHYLYARYFSKNLYRKAQKLENL